MMPRHPRRVGAAFFRADIPFPSTCAVTGVPARFTPWSRQDIATLSLGRKRDVRLRLSPLSTEAGRGAYCTELLWYAGGAVAIVRPALSRQMQVPSSLDRVPSTFQEQREIMRKLFWCGSAAGVLALGSLF